MRNLKALGLAFVAMLAMSAMAASAAQAAADGTPEFTAAQYPATLDATGDERETFTAFGSEVSCEHAKFHSTLTGPSHSLTVTPTYSQCQAVGIPGIPIAPVTVTHNGCNYKFHSLTTEGEPENTGTVTHDYYNVLVDVICPAGKVIEVHIYSNVLSHAGGNSLCTITVGSQTNLEGLTLDIHTRAPAGLNDATITGTVEGIESQMHANSDAACPGNGLTPIDTNSIYHLPEEGVTAQGRNSLGQLISVDVG